jgi:predicted DNA-binding transcriptional regulator AlpA
VASSAMNSLPSWPAMLKRRNAAAYCDLSVAEFEREVNEGRLPLPVKLGNSEHWSRRKLDEALDALHGDAGDWRSKLGQARDAA